MELLHLVYRSQVTRFFEPNHLQEILNVARTKNPKINVTGFLIFREGHFIQLLEGAEADVQMIYDKVAKDKRHRNVKLIGKTKSSERFMSDWSMAFLETPDVNETAQDIIDLLELGGNGSEAKLKSTIAAVLSRFSKGTRKFE